MAKDNYRCLSTAKDNKGCLIMAKDNKITREALLYLGMTRDT